MTERREFFWSARTLRCDAWITDADGDEYLDHTEDCLGADQMRCIFAYEPYDALIPELLNKHFAEPTDER